MLNCALDRIRSEYLEMPGLRLTRRQAQRLCGVEADVCQLVLDTLVAARFLSARADGTYARASDGDITRARPAKANFVIRRPAAAS